MLNVLRMEWYRMLKSKGTWVTLIIFTLIFLMVVVLYGLLSGNSEIARDFQRSLGIESSDFLYEEGDLTVGVNSEALDASEQPEKLLSALLPYAFQGNGCVLFIIIFMGIFATGHSATGFCKNITGVTRKWQLVLSDLVTSLLYSVIMMLIGITVSVPSLMLCYENLVIGDTGKLIGYLCTYTLLITTYGMIGSLLASLFRNRALAITTPLVWVTILGTIVYEIIDLIVNGKLNVKDFTIYDYAPYGNICMMDAGTPAGDMACAALVAAVIIVLCAGISILVGRKQDVK